MNSGGNYIDIKSNSDEMMIIFGISMLTNFATINEDIYNSNDGILKVDIFQNNFENNIEDYI